MKIFYVVGRSNSGKTRLVLGLIPELKKRGYTVGVVKHCGHGFEIDREGKDSWEFSEAGAQAVSLVSEDRFVLIRRTRKQADIRRLTEDHLKDLDMVFVEGGRGFSSMKRIEVLRKDVSESIEGPPDNLMAVIADFEIESEKPVFHPDQIEGIADFMAGEAGS